jgi:RHS repeat-associated protein
MRALLHALIRHASSAVRARQRVAVPALLCLLTLAVWFPLSAIGADPQSEQGAAAARRSTGGRLTELVDRRTRTSRTYATKDGARVTRLYQGSVNYRDNGKWRVIDNTLVPSGKPGYAFENRANRYSVRFPADLSGKPVQIQNGSDWISFSLDSAHAPGNSTRREADYAGALPAVDVSYVANSDSVKESLTLADASAPKRFRFALDTSNGLTPKKNDAGGIDFVNSTGDAAFSFAPPYMTDAAGASSDRVRLRLEHDANGYSAVLVAANGWIADAARKFPVVIDPITRVDDTNDCYMVGGSQANDHFCGYADNWMTIGRAGGTDNLNPRRGYARFDTSPIPKDAQIILGDMAFYYGAGTSRTIDINRLTRDSTTGRTWNTYDGTNAWTTPGGDIDTTAAASAVAGDAGVGWYHWFPTELVQSWVDGSNPNYGVTLKDDGNQGAGSVIQFAQHEQAGFEPYIDVKWKYRVGIEPQYTFDSQTITDRTTLRTNVANGNLLLEEDDLNIAGRGLDLNFARFFNNLDVDGGDGTLGWGWNMSTGFDVWMQEYGNGSVVRLDGTSGYNEPFIKRADGTYKSPTGLNATLVKSGSAFTLTFDRTQDKLHFPCSGCSVDWQKDRNGNQISFTYGTAGLTQITDTRGRVVTLGYDATTGYVSSLTDSTGRSWHYAYTGNKLTSYTNPAGKITQYAYDSDLNLTQITDPRGNRTKLTYDSSFRVTSIMRVTGQDGLGNDTGPTTSYTYKATVDGTCASGTFGETVITDPNGHDTTYCYDRELRVTRVKDARGKQRDTHWTPNSDADILTSASAQATTMTFDADNRMTQSRQPDVVNGGTNGLKSTLGYDSSITNKADARYQLPTTAKDTQQNQLTYGYDGNGNVTSVSDQLTSNNQVKVHRRADGQIDWVKEPNDQAQPDTNPTTSLGYNAIGELTSITRPSPLGSESFTYDGLSRPNVLTDGRGQTADYDFDAMDRLTKVTFTDGATVQYAYDDNGNLTSRTDNTGQTTYVYDKLNRLATENFPGSVQNSYTYDNAGNLKTFTDAGGTTTYNYGPSDLLDSMQAPGDTAATTFSYDNDDRRTSTAYPNAVTMTATFDNPGRLKEIKATKSGVSAPLTDFVYDYTTVPASCGGSGNGVETNLRQKVTDAAASPNKVTTYCYDQLNRLTKAAESPGSAYAYQYDGNGNITRRTKDGADTSYGFNRANELCWSVAGAQASAACSPTPTGATTFTHDAAGNMTGSSAGLALAYNSKEQTASMTSLAGGTAVAMTYAGPNQFERSAFGSTSQTTSALGVNADKTGTSTTYYRRDSDGELHSEVLPTGARHYYLFDGLGSVAALSDTTGAKSQSYTYDPYGATAVNNGSGPGNPWRYVGAYQDTTGFYKMGSRYYAPTLMRWAQQDPLEGPTDVQQLNRYSYVGDNPVNSVDPAGTQGRIPEPGAEAPPRFGVYVPPWSVTRARLVIGVARVETSVRRAARSAYVRTSTAAINYSEVASDAADTVSRVSEVAGHLLHRR